MTASLNPPVMFSIPGLNENVESESGFLQESGDQKEMTAYTIPPVVWMVIFLVVGYVGLRWVMEES